MFVKQFMSIRNTIYESLLNRGKIISKSEIIKIIEEYEKNVTKKDKGNTIKYLSRQKYIKRILSELYYINSFDERNRKFSEFEDKEVLFMALNKLGIKWYVGLVSSLYQHGKMWQTPNQISIVNTKFSGIKVVNGLKVKFYKTKEKFIFGLKKEKTKHGIEYSYSDPAKTHIDRLYFRETENLIRIKNTQEYLKRYPKWVGNK